MQIFRRLFIGIALGVGILVTPFAFASSDVPVKVHVFEREDLGHCRAVKAFLVDLSDTRDDIEITYHAVYDT